MRPDDPVVRRDAARVFREVANIDRMLGRFPHAVEAYNRSVSLLEELAQQFPETPAHRDQLAETLLDAGETMRMEGRPQNAEPFCRRASDLADRILSGSPDRPAFRRTKAECLASLAAILVETGRYAEGQAAGEQAIGLLRPFVDSVNSKYLDQIVFAMTVYEWGKSLRQGESRARPSRSLSKQFSG